MSQKEFVREPLGEGSSYVVARGRPGPPKKWSGRGSVRMAPYLGWVPLKTATDITDCEEILQLGWDT